MICPKCKKILQNTMDDIYYREGKHYLDRDCPHCGYTLSTKKTFGLKARIAFWIFIIPFITFSLVGIMMILPNYIANYFSIFIIFVAFIIAAVFQMIAKRRKNQELENDRAIINSEEKNCDKKQENDISKIH